MSDDEQYRQDISQIRIHGEHIAVLRSQMDGVRSEQQALWERLGDMDRARQADTDKLLEAITGNKMASEILQSKWKMAGAVIVAILGLGSAFVGALSLVWKFFTGAGT